MRKVTRRPLCLTCRKPLRLHTWTIWLKDGETTQEALDRENAPESHVTKLHHRGDLVTAIHYWDGRFGVRGSNRFCSIEHGYQFGRRAATPVWVETSEATNGK